MQNLSYQLQLHFKRLIIRKPGSFFFNLFFPIFFYVLYTRVFVFPMTGDGLRIWQIDYLLSMIIFGVLMVAITNISTVLLEDHMNHVDLFVELSPMSKWRYYFSVLLVFIPFYLFVTILTGAVAYFVNGVVLDVGQWLGFLVIILISLVPFYLIGVAVSLAGNPTAVGIIGNLVSFPLAILGGLWWPLDFMPEIIQQIGHRLPTYMVAELARTWVHDGEIVWSALLGLGVWTLLLLGLIVIIRVIIQRKEPQLI